MRMKSAIVFTACALALGLAACEAEHTAAGPGGVGTPAVTTDHLVGSSVAASTSSPSTPPPGRS